MTEREQQWLNTLPRRAIGTGVQVTLHFDVYSDGHGVLFHDGAEVKDQPVNNLREAVQKFTWVWERAQEQAASQTSGSPATN